MSGISFKAAGKLENRFKFNCGSELESKEFKDGTGLEWYTTDFSKYDAQIGRFTQIDLLSEVKPNNSGYVFASNNPICLNDPTGLLDSIGVNSNGETIYHNKGDDLADVVVTPKAKTSFNWLGWSNYNGQTGKQIQDQTDVQLQRKNQGLPYLPYGDTVFYNHKWQAEQDWRTMNYAVATALIAPFAIEGIVTAAPGIGTSISSLSTNATSLISESGVVTNYDIQRVSALVRNSAIQAVLSTVPLSLSSAKALINLQNSPIASIDYRSVFVATKFILSQFLPSGILPSNNVIWPKSK